MKQQSQKILQRRKLLIALPFLALPFITLAFWAMGGGTASTNSFSSKKSGLNLELPNPNLKKDAIDKLAYYEKAARDSLKLKDEMQNDPYFQKALDTSSTRSVENISPSISQSSASVMQKNEEQVYSKLKQINDVVNSNNDAVGSNDTKNYSVENNQRSIDKKDIDRLAEMMQNVNQYGDDDPEMKQMNSMLEKILDIQHPERITEKIRQTSITHQNQAFPVVTEGNQNYYSSFPTKTDFNKDSIIKVSNGIRNKFYSPDDEITNGNFNQNSIQAVIHETQSIVSGSTVKLRLMNDVYVNGLLIPKGNFIFGIGQMDGDRLHIIIKSILYKNDLLPVDLSVFDLDGMEGIHIPGSISKDAGKQITNNALEGIGLSSLNPSIGGQAISTGLEAGKDLIKRKASLIKVTVKAGYQVILINNGNEQKNF